MAEGIDMPGVDIGLSHLRVARPTDDLAASFVGEECDLALATSGCVVVPVLLDGTPLPTELGRFHGTADLAPLFQTLARRKLLRRLLWLTWLLLAIILAAITMPIIYKTSEGPRPKGFADFLWYY